MKDMVSGRAGPVVLAWVLTIWTMKCFYNRSQTGFIRHFFKSLQDRTAHLDGPDEKRHLGFGQEKNPPLKDPVDQEDREDQGSRSLPVDPCPLLVLRVIRNNQN